MIAWCALVMLPVKSPRHTLYPICPWCTLTVPLPEVQSRPVWPKGPIIKTALYIYHVLLPTFTYLPGWTYIKP